MANKNNTPAAVPDAETLDLGIPKDAVKKITAGLSRLLADTYTVYLKTHNYHWNVTGPHFNSLHQMFEEQYSELAVAVDDIAERIRSLGAWAPGSYTEFAALATVKEAVGVATAEKMVADLAADQATIARSARELLAVASDAADEATADLLTQRIQVHEKTAWMLQATIV